MKEIKWERIIINILTNLLGIFGLSVLTYIMCMCMLYGGINWEILISFNKKGEGIFEISMIILFLVLNIINVGYMIVDFIYKAIIERKKRNYEQNESLEWSRITNKCVEKYNKIEII